VTDKTTISHGLILAPSRSLERKKSGLIKRGLKLAGEIVRLLSAKDYYESGQVKMLDDRDEQGAIEDLTKAIELDPGYAAAYCSRGLAKFILDDYQGGGEDCTKAIELGLDKDDLELSYSLLGDIKYNLGDYQGSIEDFTKAIELDPGDGFYYSWRGGAKRKLGDYQGAVDDYTKAILLVDPPKAADYYYRGAVKRKLGDQFGAENDIERAENMGFDPSP